MAFMPQKNLSALIQSMRVGTKFIARYPSGKCSLFKVYRKRGSKFQCAIINGAHFATFNAEGYSVRRQLTIVYVRESDDCPYTINDYNTGLSLFEKESSLN